MKSTNPATPRACSMPAFTGALVAAITCLAAPAAAAQAQPAATPPAKPAATSATSAPSPSDTVELSPFEVRAAPEDSYGALESNSLTAFRMDLLKMPATAQTFTQTFINDTAAESIEQMLIDNAGVVTASSNNTGAYLEEPGDRDGGPGISVRGASGDFMRRDGFRGPHPSGRTASGYSDVFSTERVEVIEGPQSILYGAVGGGGVINAVTKQANFRQQKGSLRLSFDQYGGKRGVFDFNLGLDRAAVRFSVLGAEKRQFRYNLGSDISGYFLAFAYKVGRRGVLRLHTEKIDNFSMHSRTPNLNNFFPSGDPRRGQNARFLALTGQLDNMRNVIWDGEVNYENVESFAAWWQSEHTKDHFSGLEYETSLPRFGLSAKVQGYYDEMVDNRGNVFNATLVPGKGKHGAGANPFAGTAYRLPAGNMRDDVQRNRDRGVRATLLHEKDFSFWRLRGNSRTALSFSYYHQYPGAYSGGVQYGYYLADASGQPVIDSTRKTEYGRIPLAFDQYVEVQHGIPLRPLYEPTTPRITVNGQHYVRLQRIETNPANETPDNFKGAVPNNGKGGFTGKFNNNAETHSRYYSITNVTDWFDGRLISMLGYGFTDFESLNFSLRPPNTFVKFTHLDGWGAGLNYRLRPGLRAYALISKSAQASGSTDDILGVPLRTPDAVSPIPELGLKYRTADNRFSAQLNWNPATLTRYENRNIGDASFTNIINPNGINTRFGTGTRTQQRVNLDRTLEAVGLVLTAQPTRNWRLRFSASHLDGEVENTVAYHQLYNDQFHLSNGTVTYTDGAPVMVDPAGLGGAATTPLTLAMINNPASAYYAMPDVSSGSITNELLRTALTTIDPVHGTAATGVTGLPITDIQYHFTSPYPDGLVTIFAKGEKNTGFNEYTFNFQNHYNFTRGSLRGLGLFANVRTYYRNRAYYTNYPGAGGHNTAATRVRELYRLPSSTVFDLGLSYRRKLPWFGERFTWSTQLNINNLFNHYRVWIMPNPGNGTQLRARLSTSPRRIVWTNTFEF